MNRAGDESVDDVTNHHSQAPPAGSYHESEGSVYRCADTLTGRRPTSRSRQRTVGSRPVPWRTLMVGLAVALVVAGCGRDSAPESSTGPISPPVAQSGGGRDVVLLSGSVEIPGAQAFGAPGFHEPVLLTGAVPEAAAGVSGELVVRLRDAGRPNQTCDRNHPSSGCVTVDWSDFEDRPGVPPGGVFDNRLTVVSPAGPVALFLSETRGLASEPDAYSPG